MSEAIFTCYLGNGECDYLTLPIADGPHPTEMGDAVDHFEAKYPARSWRLYTLGMEDMEPLYTFTPGRNAVEEAEMVREELLAHF